MQVNLKILENKEKNSLLICLSFSNLSFVHFQAIFICVFEFIIDFVVQNNYKIIR
jgi:hypothetical protein